MISQNFINKIKPIKQIFNLRFLKKFFFYSIMFTVVVSIITIALYANYINTSCAPEINVNSKLPYSKKYEYIDRIFKMKKEIAPLRNTNPKEYKALIDTAIRTIDGLSESCFGSSKLQGIFYKSSSWHFLKYVSFMSVASTTVFYITYFYYLTHYSPDFVCSFDVTGETTTYDPELIKQAATQEEGRRFIAESLAHGMLQASKNNPDIFFKDYISYTEKIDLENYKNLIKLCL